MEGTFDPLSVNQLKKGNDEIGATLGEIVGLSQVLQKDISDAHPSYPVVQLLAEKAAEVHKRYVGDPKALVDGLPDGVKSIDIGEHLFKALTKVQPDPRGLPVDLKTINLVTYFAEPDKVQRIFDVLLSALVEIGFPKGVEVTVTTRNAYGQFAQIDCDIASTQANAFGMEEIQQFASLSQEVKMLSGTLTYTTITENRIGISLLLPFAT